MSTDILLKSDQTLLSFPESLKQFFFLNTCRSNCQCYGSRLYLIRLEIRLEVTKYCPVTWFGVLSLRGIYFIKAQREPRENTGLTLVMLWVCHKVSEWLCYWCLGYCELKLFFLCQAVGLLGPSLPKYSPVLYTVRCYTQRCAHLVL